MNLTIRRASILGVAALAAFAVTYAVWQGASAWWAWNSIERVDFDLAEARRGIDGLQPSNGDGGNSAVPPVKDPPAEEYLTVLIMGSDAAPETTSDEFADAILLYAQPADGGPPSIVSFPRDTVVVDPCTGSESKINRMLTPCDASVSSAEHVALAMEGLAGIEIDHFALLRLEALASVIDQVGGVEICSEHALREGSVDLLPAGCSVVDGAHAVAWVQSRSTQEFVDGEWAFASELGDAARVARHRVLLFALLDRLKGVQSPGDLAGLARSLGDSVVLSQTLGIGDAVALAWDLRSQPASSIRTITMPTEPDPLNDGSYAVRATATVRELLEG